MSKEKTRLANPTPWRYWGPYLSDRQWGTVREDYSADGSAWDYMSFEQSRFRAYRWGEEGIGGISDLDQLLCFSGAFWNHNDSIIKDRLFGLSGTQGNHGEDVKENYYYLDNTPTHSYMKMLYKYPQNYFPYEDLVQKNRHRTKRETEYELIDTGIFDKNEYFDIFIEYAKNSTEDILIKYTIKNQSEKKAPITVVPQLWFRNIWSWKETRDIPEMRYENDYIVAEHPQMDTYYLYAENHQDVLFCDNNTNIRKIFNLESQHYFKDGINDYILHNENCLNPEKKGTKAGFQYYFDIPAKESVTIKLRLVNTKLKSPFKDFDSIFLNKAGEADEFYEELLARTKTEEDVEIQRQSLGGMLWSKQFYYYDVKEWMEGDEKQPKPPASRKEGRNNEWIHLKNHDIISMPDKWEYPWYAAWDLAFHCISLNIVDPDFAKSQLLLMTKEWYMHPNGQLPAYEWAFSDVNPPVHAWASWRVFQSEKKKNNGVGDYLFLEKVFHKLMLNFTWWVNRKDPQGRNLFQGGFLGLDNIGIFDRSAPLPTGGYINQSDGTSWMAMYALNMMRIAIELASRNPAYEDIAIKFFEHFLQIAEAMTNLSGEENGLWDEQEGFYFDVLNLNDGQQIPLRLFSIVGLIPLFAVEVLESETLDKLPNFSKRLNWILENRQDLASLVSRWYEPGVGEKRLLSLLRGSRMKKILHRMLDPEQFLSDYGIRALSKYHLNNPFKFEINSISSTVKYQPAESDTGIFGGNSNWRGPIWFPINYLIIESLRRFYNYYGDDFKIEFPTGSGKMLTIMDVALEISDRLANIFRLNENGERPVYSQYPQIKDQEEFNKYPLFYEYFHGDSGRGIGASHQTGWTGLIAKLIYSFSK